MFLKLPADRLAHDWAGARVRAQAYAEALGLPGPRAAALAGRALDRAATAEHWPPGTTAREAALEALRQLWLEEEHGVPSAVAAEPECFAAARLAQWAPPPDPLAEPRAARGADKPRRSPVPLATHGSAPPVERHALRPQRLAGAGLARPDEGPARRGRPAWSRVALRRRITLAALVVLPAIVASGAMARVLPYHGRSALEATIVLGFGVLFGWVSLGFWTAVLGFVSLVRGGDRFAPTRTPQRPASALDPGARAALLMPVCDEPVDRVLAGLEAMRASLERAGALERFDFFLLSDSGDPDAWVDEEEAWGDWQRHFGAAGRLFYRRRRVRRKRKSGNVADFCRRWGSRYRYMVMLDADSVMTGDLLVRLLDVMETHPDAAVVQTLPRAVGRRSLFGRVQQFASWLYGPVFAAGLHYWQLGDAPYWGHNAILRTAPFVRHCGLPRLPGRAPWGGDILSHDFVEAALLGRAGHTLWLAHDLDGSFEEVPGSLLEEMRRDRRWCQGNLQHLRLLSTQGLVPAHRALLLNGALSYVSALLWFSFLALSTAKGVADVLQVPDYFPDGPSLFPDWPVWHPERALALLGVTGVVLFVPKLLAAAWVLGRRGAAKAYGGAPRVVAGVALEIALSALLAPVRMMFHSKFVLTNLLGRTVGWRSQDRADTETRWRDALRAHGFDMALGAIWGVAVYRLDAGHLPWLVPVVAALVLAVPLSVWTSRVAAGEAARRAGLFSVPGDTRPDRALRDLEEAWARRRRERARRRPRSGFARAVVDPGVAALHAALRRGPRRLAPAVVARRRELARRALGRGPATLAAPERESLLLDAPALAELHRAVWAAPAAQAAAWGCPIGPGELDGIRIPPEGQGASRKHPEDQGLPRDDSSA